jgi:hypothetical protein
VPSPAEAAAQFSSNKRRRINYIMPFMVAGLQFICNTPPLRLASQSMRNMQSSQYHQTCTLAREYKTNPSLNIDHSQIALADVGSLQVHDAIQCLSAVASLLFRHSLPYQNPIWGVFRNVDPTK